MYAFSATVEVNPAGARPVLSRDQLWQGLLMKAENAVPFVPGMESCLVLERGEGNLIREIAVHSQRFKELVTFTPQDQIHLQRIEGDETGWITNIVSESDRGLLLTFTFALSDSSVPAGSSKEKRREEAIKSAYFAAVDKTIRTVRQLAAEGKI